MSSTSRGILLLSLAALGCASVAGAPFAAAQSAREPAPVEPPASLESGFPLAPAPPDPARRTEETAPGSGGSASGPVAAERVAPAWELFPDTGRVFRPLRADPREALFHVGVLYDREEDLHMDLSLGADLGLVGAELRERGRVSLTVRGLVTARFDGFSESFDLLNSDFIGGLALGYGRKHDSLELLLSHQSSHLGDEILDRGERSRIDYAKETVRLMTSRRWDRVRGYGGVAYSFHGSLPEIGKRLVLQAGLETDLQLLGFPMFGALDAQSREEHDWTANIAAKWGVALGDPRKAMNRQWAFLSFFHGYSEMGQFRDLRETYGMLGVEYQFR